MVCNVEIIALLTCALTPCGYTVGVGWWTDGAEYVQVIADLLCTSSHDFAGPSSREKKTRML